MPVAIAERTDRRRTRRERQNHANGSIDPAGSPRPSCDNLATRGQANFRGPTPGCLFFGVWMKSGCLVLVLVLDEEHDAGPVDFHAVDGLAVMLGSLAGCQRILA